MKRRRNAGLFLLTVVFTPASATAQTLIGRVLEEGRNTPVSGALVSLVDRDGERRRAQAMADSLGRFALAVPQAGEYVVEAARIGYEATRSPLLSMTVEGSVPFDLVMRPLPIGLEGFEVSVDKEAVRLLRNYGHTPASLGRRWIDRDKIARAASAQTPADVIRWQSVAGISIPVTNASPLNEPLCVTTQHANTVRSAKAPCALTLLNGVVIGRLEASQIDPHDIEAIAILTPMDGTTFYGTVAGGGGRSSSGRGKGGR